MQIYNFISLLLYKMLLDNFLEAQEKPGIKLEAKIVEVKGDTVKININGRIFEAKWVASQQPRINEKILLMLEQVDTEKLVLRVLDKEDKTLKSSGETKLELEKLNIKKLNIELKDDFNEIDIRNQIKEKLSSLNLDNSNIYIIHIPFRHNSHKIDMYTSFKRRYKNIKLAKILVNDEKIGSISANLMLIGKKLLVRLVVEKKETFKIFKDLHKELTDSLKECGFSSITLSISNAPIEKEELLKEEFIEEKV
ncbi:MAG: hypothetical protein ACPLSJ_02865 [Thermosulfidibacteraceae bacterium]